MRHPAFDARVEHVEWVSEDGREGAGSYTTGGGGVRAKRLVTIWLTASEHPLHGGVRAHACFVQAQFEDSEGDIASQVSLPAQHEPPQGTAVRCSNLLYCCHGAISKAQHNALRKREIEKAESESTVITEERYKRTHNLFEHTIEKYICKPF